jgi:hypothetical protein
MQHLACCSPCNASAEDLLLIVQNCPKPFAKIQCPLLCAQVCFCVRVAPRHGFCVQRRKMREGSFQLIRTCALLFHPLFMSGLSWTVSLPQDAFAARSFLRVLVHRPHSLNTLYRPISRPTRVCQTCLSDQ